MRAACTFLLVSFLSFLNVAGQTVGIFQNTPDAFDGYTLFAPTNYTETYLINNCGEKVHSWPSQYEPGSSSYLLENGVLLRPGVAGGANGVINEMIDWNGNVIWSHSVMSTHGRQHHDLEYLPNGNILLIVKDTRTQAEVTQAGGTTTSSTVNSDKIVEIQPDTVNGGATVVWEWKAWDHTINDVNNALPNYGNVSQHPEKININYGSLSNNDWLHFNGISYNKEFDQIIVSVRNFNEFWIIDHSTTTAEAADTIGGTFGKGGDLLYRWGNPETYDQGTALDRKLFLQHHTHWIDSGYKDAGKIILFNNEAGTNVGQNYSTVNTVDLPVDVNGFYTYSGGAYGPTNFDWTYQATVPTDFYSSKISGATRLENGNTLVCQGVGGRFFELDTADNVVWEYINPVINSGPLSQGSSTTGNNVFRNLRYSPNYPGLAGKTLTPQGYIETGSTQTCTLYPVSVNDIISENENLTIYPNPTNSVINIDLSMLKGNKHEAKIECYNSISQLVYLKDNISAFERIDVKNWKKGIYFIKVSNSESSLTRKIIITH